VPEADAQRAEPIVERYRQTDAANAADDAERPRATWTCPQCGEKVEDQFTNCWKCGHSRPTGTGGALS
jgi:ribosomal protein L37AE/L43A